MAFPETMQRHQDSTAPEPPPAARLPGVVLAICAGVGLATALAGAIGLIELTRTLMVLTYMLAAGTLLPAIAVLGSSRAMLALPPSGARDAALAASLAAVALLCGLRLLGMAGAAATITSSLAILGGLTLTASVVWIVRRSGPPRQARALLVRLTPERLPVAAVLLLGSVVLVFAPSELTPLGLGLAALVGVIATLCEPALPLGRGTRYKRILADLIVLTGIALLIIDVSGYWGEDVLAPTPVSYPFYNAFSASAQVFQHFVLGPVNDVIHGRALLVDANSVYGIGNTYLEALWFLLVPISYGTLILFGGLVSLVATITGWAITRAAGVSRTVAAITITLAAMLEILNPTLPPTIYVNLGGLRFLPAIVPVAVAMAAYRAGRSISRSPWVLLTIGYFSTWSLEAITYASGAYIGLLAVDVVASSTLRRAIVELARSVAAVIGACVAAHVVFGLVTLTVAGSWPDWSEYLGLFEAWSRVIDSFGTNVEPWSRAWLVGGLYAASAVGFVALLRAGANKSKSQSRMLIAIGGLTGAGTALLSYFVSHTIDRYLLFSTLPAILLSSIWLSYAARTLDGAGWRRATLAFGAFLAAAIVAGDLGTARERLPATALAHLVPGGPSLSEDARRLLDPPPINPNADAAVDLIDGYFPANQALVLTEPDLGQEALLESDRANLLPISFFWQDEINLGNSLAPVLETIDSLPAGTPALLQEPPEPGSLPTAEQVFGNVPRDSRLGPLAQLALDRIRDRFELRRVASGPDGLYVARLEPRALEAPGR